ncbi:MAG: DNA-binding response regulator [marine bacterium B5-7]|nr:MAG: DNA-binding response regulator [marine bacterium B5-7]
MATKVLIVEDEHAIRQMVTLALSNSGFEVLEAGDAELARSLLLNEPPDLILMDWMLPGASGIELTRSLKADKVTRDIPVIMLTARGDEDDKVRGLDSGAEDYISKPFSPREMIARIKAVLRRVAPHATEEAVSAENLTLDPSSHRVCYNDAPIDMGPTEFRLLHFFMTHQDKVYSRSRLLDRVWGTNVYIEERTVDVHIRRLRKALEPFGADSLLQTVRGAGYRFSIGPNPHAAA